MLKILKIAKQAKEKGYSYIGFNLDNEPEKVKELVNFTKNHNLFCEYGLSENELLELSQKRRYIGLDLKRMANLVNFDKLVWCSGHKMRGNPDIKVEEFRDLVYLGFWL